MDEADEAQIRSEVYMTAALSRIRPQLHIKATGYCLNCLTVLAKDHRDKRWRDIECMDDWVKREKQ